MRRVVDLPQPDGPTRTINSLSLMERLKSCTASTPSSVTVRLLLRSSAPFFFFFFPPAATCTITKSAATSRYSSISPMFRASPFDDYFLRGAFAPSPMEAMESRMAVSAMVFFIS